MADDRKAPPPVEPKKPEPMADEPSAPKQNSTDLANAEASETLDRIVEDRFEATDN
jgi:hypothetical protein